MKKTLPSMAAFALILLFTQCAERKLSAHSKETPPRDVAAKKIAYSPDQLAQGKTICMDRCADCHDFHEPAEFTIKEWNHILPGMCRKAKLTADEAGMVKAWVISNAKPM